MTLQEYIIEHLSEVIQININEDLKDDSDNIKIDVQALIEPGKRYIKENMDDDELLSIEDDGETHYAWTDSGWQLFYGETKNGAGGLLLKKVRDIVGGDGTTINNLNTWLAQNQLSTDLLIPEKEKRTEEEQKEYDKKQRQKKAAQKKKEKGEKTEEEGEDANKMSPKELREAAKLLLDGKQKVDDKTLSLEDKDMKKINNRVVYLICTKYYLETLKVLHESKSYKEMTDMVAELGMEKNNGLSRMICAMCIAKNINDKGDGYVPFSKDDCFSFFVGEEADDTNLVNFCALTCALYTMLNSGFNEEQTTKIANLVGLLKE